MENFADYIDGFMTCAVKYKPYVLLSVPLLTANSLYQCVLEEMKKTKL
jgi:hypothetical protein